MHSAWRSAVHVMQRGLPTANRSPGGNRCCSSTTSRMSSNMRLSPKERSRSKPPVCDSFGSVGKSAVILVGGVLLFAADASAADEPQLDITPQQLLAQPSSEREAPTRDEATEGLQERPRRPGLVLESTLGVLGFAGNFRHVAPPAYWVRGQLGYEVTRGLMLYVDGEAGW